MKMLRRFCLGGLLVTALSPAVSFAQEPFLQEWPGLSQGERLLAQFGLQSHPPLDLDWTPQVAPGFQGAAEDSQRRSVLLREGWLFYSCDASTGALGEPQQVTVPHRFPGDRNYKSGWYVLPLNCEMKPGRQYVIRFDQVPLYAVLRVNGTEVGSHRGVYTPFAFDVTEALKPGVNRIALYVHDASAAVVEDRALNQLGVARPTSASSMMGGVFGGVTLESRPAVAVDDVFIKTSTRRSNLTAVFEVVNHGLKPEVARLQSSVLSWPDGKVAGVVIPEDSIEVQPGETRVVTLSTTWKNPELWSPESPNLYVLRVRLKTSEGEEVCDTRFGFREFWTEGKRFMLNGHPIRLLGESHFRYGRLEESTDPANGRDYNRSVLSLIKKLFQTNAVRLHASIVPGTVALGADEAGVMLISQSSIWSAMGSHYRNGGELFLKNTRKEFAEWVRRDRNSPSVVIWDVENEMIRGGRDNMPWVMQLDGFIREHDDTRPVEHSGAGWYDKEQEIVHLHMQEHYAEILSKWSKEGKQPLTVGEVWVGGRGETRLPSSKEFVSKRDWFEEEARCYEEALLEMRFFGSAGAMPFRISTSYLLPPKDGRDFLVPDEKGIPAHTILSQKAVARVRHGLQPVTVFFWPRIEAATPGERLGAQLVLCNDSEKPRQLTLEWSLERGGETKRKLVLLNPGEQIRTELEWLAPKEDARLQARVLEDGKALSHDSLDLRVYRQDLHRFSGTRRLVVWGAGEGAGEKAVSVLKALGVQSELSSEIPALPGETIWVIPPGNPDPRLRNAGPAIRQFLENGGRILCLAQTAWPSWSPLKLGFWPAVREVPTAYAEFGWPNDSKGLYYSTSAPIYAQGHPVFDGIRKPDLRWWSSFDGRVSDDVIVRPTAVGLSAPGAWRVLAGGTRRELVSLGEARVGKGLLFFCQAQVLEAAGNAEARTVLGNVIRYLDGAAWGGGPGRAWLAKNGIDASMIEAMTGVALKEANETSQSPGDLIIAGDEANLNDLSRWVSSGGRVLVLSAETAGRIPGFAVKKDPGQIYAASRGEDHPLLWGVSSENFTGFGNPCVEGEFTVWPSEATVLLSGLKGRAEIVRRGGVGLFEKGLVGMDSAGPVAVSYREGAGEWIVTTLAPWRERSPHNETLMSLLLANTGLEVPLPQRHPLQVRALKTAPLEVDGQLGDWTSDMEDRNVSKYRHAEPLVVSSESAISGEVEGDPDLSAILYFMWSPTKLYLAGTIFNGGGGDLLADVTIGEKTVQIERPGKNVKAAIDGKAASVNHAGADVDSSELADIRQLSFTKIDKRVGNLVTTRIPVGRTFEIELPWSELGLSSAPEALPLKVMIRRGRNDVLSVPQNLDQEMTLVFKE